MFVPPYDSVLKALGTSRAAVENQAVISVPTALLNMLLKIAIDSAEFNEKGYLRSNPDVAKAINAGQLTSVRDHYVRYGYFEGRRGATPPVDEHWYRKMNPDVTTAIRNGALASAEEHYLLSGVDEFRSPNEVVSQDCLNWKAAVFVSKI